MNSDLVFASKYPFTSVAKDIVKNTDYTLTPSLIALAEARVYDAILGQLKTIPISADDDYLLKNVYAYPLSNIIFSSMNNYTFAKRYACAEADRMVQYLKKDQSAEPIILKELNLNLINSDKDYKLQFIDYLVHAPTTDDYMLVNSKLEGGYVYLTELQKFDIIANSISLKILSSIPPSTQKLPAYAKKSADLVRSKLPTPKTEAKFNGHVAPCMTKLISNMRKGINLNHNSRWSLAVYLVNIGWENEKIVELFANSSNFDRRTTEYQISYLREKGYSVPSCDTLNSYGVCPGKCGAKHPLNYWGQ